MITIQLADIEQQNKPHPQIWNTTRYHLSNPQPDDATELSLIPLELIDRIAALVPPPRVHRYRYHGVLVPNSPLRAQVTALAQQTTEETPSITEADKTDGPDALSRSPAGFCTA